MPFKRLLKMAVFGVCLILTTPLIIVTWLEKKIFKNETIFVGFSQLLALIPGLIGTYLRAAYYYASLSQCSWETHIGFGSIFTHRSVSLGRNVSMGAYCVIGHADIGDNVMMASRVSIPSGKRQHFDHSGRLSSETRYDRVVIGNKSWIGEGAIIMAEVGSQSIVSAGTVVVKDMPNKCLIGGNPARVLKNLQPNAIDSGID